jgi:hypothetical protein
MMRAFIMACVASVAAASPGLAEGFVTRDLSAVTIDTTLLSPGDWISRVAPERTTLACLGCAGDPVVDVLIGRQDDGTEGRVRAGETTMDDLQAQCQQNDPNCLLRALDVAPAVGWITEYTFGEQAAQTVVVLQDGDLLTIRVLSADAAITTQNVDALLTQLIPQIVAE